MKEPTEEQIKRFWEWCGFTKELRWSDPNDIVPRGQFAVWWYPDKHAVVQHLSNVPIDPNNLFKYAVPKLSREMAKYKVMYLLKDWIEAVAIEDKDPALALFWAIYKALEIE